MSIANTSQSKKLMTLIPAILFAVASWPNNAQAEVAASCVNLTQSKQVIRLAPDKIVATAKNNCSGTQRFRMIWAFAADGSCISIRAGGSHTERRGILSPPSPSVSELRKC